MIKAKALHFSTDYDINDLHAPHWRPFDRSNIQCSTSRGDQWHVFSIILETDSILYTFIYYY